MSCLLIHGEVSESKVGYARVYFPAEDIVSDFLPIVKTRAAGSEINWPLKVGEQVACVMIFTEDDRCDTGVILGALNNDEDEPDSDAGLKKYRMKLEGGGVLEYDGDSNKWTMGGGTAELLGNANNLVKHTALDAALQRDIVTFINTQLSLIAAGIAAGGGSYTPGTMTIDISAAKVNELKCP